MLLGNQRSFLKKIKTKQFGDKIIKIILSPNYFVILFS